MPPEPTYYVQISDPEEPERWHTVARVEGRELADEVIRLAQGSYMRTTVHGRVPLPAPGPSPARSSAATSASRTPTGSWAWASTATTAARSSSGRVAIFVRG